MSSPSSRLSARLRRAAAAERGRLAEQRGRIERAQGDIRAELARLEQELANIDARLDLLVRIAPSDPHPDPEEADQPHAPPLDAPRAPRVLCGPAVRVTAVRLLAGRRPAVQAIHYRDWYRLLEADGFAVAGKKPLAVFLSQVSRSPMIRKTMSAGVYELERDAPQRLRAELEAQLQALAAGPTDRPDRDRHGRRKQLVQAIGRRERALAEARASLAVSPG